MTKFLSTVTGFLVGGAIGAATGILLAPASGVETRQKIKDNAIEARERAIAAVDNTRDRLVESAENVQTKARQLLEDTGKEAEQRARRLKNIGQKTFQEQKASIESGVTEAKDVLNP
jgi:gas vesicle protein